MSALSGTTWQVTGTSAVDTWTMTFKNDGTVNITSGGSGGVGYYAETGDGIFIIQQPGTTSNPKIATVWTGRHAQGVGTGDIQTYPGGQGPNYTVLTGMSMIKS
jgi:hypothetical protein